MESFVSKYPAFSSLLGLVASFAQDAAVPGETILQKLEGATNLISPLVSFLPNIGSLAAELTALEAAPTDIESGVEAFIIDLGFSSPSAKAIIAAAFPFAEGIVALIPQGEALVAAIKG